MLQIDDSLLTDETYDFLKRWALSLKVSVAELSGRILAAGVSMELLVDDKLKFPRRFKPKT